MLCLALTRKNPRHASKLTLVKTACFINRSSFFKYIYNCSTIFTYVTITALQTMDSYSDNNQSPLIILRQCKNSKGQEHPGPSYSTSSKNTYWVQSPSHGSCVIWLRKANKRMFKFKTACLKTNELYFSVPLSKETKQDLVPCSMAEAGF